MSTRTASTPDDSKLELPGPGSSDYYSTRFLPPAMRREVRLLLAWRRALADIVQQSREPGVAQARLDWWQQETARIFDGQAQHPLARALHKVVERHHLQAEYFEEVLAGYAMDLRAEIYPDMASLNLYCQRVGGTLFLLCSQVCGDESRAMQRYAQQAGQAVTLCRVLRDTGRDLSLGRLRLPADALQRHQLTPASLQARPLPPKAGQLMHELLETAQARLDTASRQAPPAKSMAARFIRTQIALHTTLLKELLRHPESVFTEHTTLTPLRKLWIAWRQKK